MNKWLKNDFFWLAVTAAILIIITYRQFVFHPNSYLLNASGDAFKNYFTPAWYVKYDTGAHFTGMNYPFGEHVVFTDNQPVLTGIINLIDNHILNISDYTIGILNFLLFVSLFFTVLLVYRILIFYKLPLPYSFIAALIIGFMSPQLARFSGHFSLGYSVYIPLLWWLAIKMKENNYKKKIAIILIAVILFFSFIHVYYLFTAFLFFIIQFIVLLCKRKKYRRQLFSLFSIALAPVLLFVIFMDITDKVDDRTNSPYGFFDYKATFQSVFLKEHGYLQDLLQEKLHSPAPDFEGYAYVGIASLFVFIFSIVWFIKRYVSKRKFFKSLFHLPGDLNIYLISAIIILLFSMALPFSLGLHFLLDIITPIKQFRSPGRFAWIFYYVFTVYSAVIIYLLFRMIKIRQQTLAFIFLFTIIYFQAKEVYLLTDDKSKSIYASRKKNPFTSNDGVLKSQLNSSGINFKEFQSILFIPSFFQGSEKLYVDRTEGDLNKAMEIAYDTGLPLMDVMMSRTSVSQTLHLASLTGHPAIEKKLPHQFSYKPILLVCSNKQLTKSEQYLVNNSIFIGSISEIKLYRLPLNVFMNEPKLITDEFIHLKDSLKYFSSGQYMSVDSNYIFYHRDFEEYNSPEPFFGKGSFYFKDKNRTELDIIPVNISDTIWIEVSFWAKSYIQTSAFPSLKILFLNEKDQTLKEHSVTSKFSTDIIGDWVRASENYEVIPEVKKIEIIITKGSKINIDELVIRHTAYDMYYGIKNDSTLIYNNYPVNLVDQKE